MAVHVVNGAGQRGILASAVTSSDSSPLWIADVPGLTLPVDFETDTLIVITSTTNVVQNTSAGVSLLVLYEDDVLTDWYAEVDLLAGKKGQLQIETPAFMASAGEHVYKVQIFVGVAGTATVKAGSVLNIEG